MPRIHAWDAKRSGGRITITHATGKIANIDRIYIKEAVVYAIDKDGKEYILD